MPKCVIQPCDFFASTLLKHTRLCASGKDTGGASLCTLIRNALVLLYFVCLDTTQRAHDKMSVRDSLWWQQVEIWRSIMAGNDAESKVHITFFSHSIREWALRYERLRNLFHTPAKFYCVVRTTNIWTLIIILLHRWSDPFHIMLLIYTSLNGNTLLCILAHVVNCIETFVEFRSLLSLQTLISIANYTSTDFKRKANRS